MVAQSEPLRVLVVCMGNICRSPMAEGVLRAAVRSRGLEAQVVIDSAGTHGYHAGKAPDEKAQAEAAKRGLDISALRSREITRDDLTEFDLVLAMDRQNRDHLRYMVAPPERERIQLFLEVGLGKRKDVPDPYGGRPRHFTKAMNLIEKGAVGVVEHLARQLDRAAR